MATIANTQRRRPMSSDLDFGDDYSYRMGRDFDEPAQVPEPEPASQAVAPEPSNEVTDQPQLKSVRNDYMAADDYAGAPSGEQSPAPKGMSYADWFTQHSKANNNQDNREYDAKKRRREAIVSAIGDGISSVANLLATTKGAPNSFDPKLSLSSKNYQRWEKLKQQQQADAQNYYANLYKWQKMDEDIKRRQAQDAATASWREMQNDMAKERLQRDRDRDKTAAEAKSRAESAAKDKFEWQKREADRKHNETAAKLNLSRQRESRISSNGSRGGGNKDIADFERYESLKAQYPDFASAYEKEIGVNQGATAGRTGKGMTANNARQGIAHIEQSVRTAKAKAAAMAKNAQNVQKKQTKTRKPSALR